MGGASAAPLGTVWPTFWTEAHDVRIWKRARIRQCTNLLVQIVGWFCAVVVDEIGYQIMGDSSGIVIAAVNESAVGFTPTRTTYTVHAGPVIVNATFLTPITVGPCSCDYSAVLKIS